jgi:hypothetical protein
MSASCHDASPNQRPGGISLSRKENDNNITAQKENENNLTAQQPKVVL